MSTELDVEQLQSTKSEKLLALVLAVFLLIGGVWAYQEIDDKVRDAMPVRNPSAAEQQAIRTLDRAQQRRFRAEETVRRTRSELELRREAYRTALDAGEPAAALRTRYRAADAAFQQARANRQRAVRAEAAARPAATAAQAASEPRRRAETRPAGARDLPPAHGRSGLVRAPRVPAPHAARGTRAPAGFRSRPRWCSSPPSSPSSSPSTT